MDNSLLSITPSNASFREEKALSEARIMLAGDRTSAQSALQCLPLKPDDVPLIQMSLGLERRDTRAMMLGKAAVELVEFRDAAAGLGIARALEEFWTGPGQTDDRYQPLARVELGSILVMQAGAMVRLGQADRAVALVNAYPGLHGRQGYIAIRAAEGLARAQRFDEARVLLPPDRPAGDIAEAAGWDVVNNLLSGLDRGDDDPDGDGNATGTIEQRWHTAIDKLSLAIIQVGERLGVPAMVGLLAPRLAEERTKPPSSEAELAKRLEGLRSAIRRGLGVG